MHDEDEDAVRCSLEFHSKPLARSLWLMKSDTTRDTC